MALEVPLLLQALTGDAAISYTAAQLRSMIDALAPLPGVTKKADLQVVQRGAGANMSVDVLAGQAAIQGASAAYQGTYLVRSTATVNVPITAAPSSGTRTDTIVAVVYDKQSDGSTSLYSWTPAVVTGSTGFPASYIPLATINVVTGHTSIVTADLTDKRTLNTLGDVPLWEVSGGNGQTIAAAPGSTAYTGWTVSDSIGMASVTTGAGVTIQQAGRYYTSFGARITAGGTGANNRQIYILHTRSGTTIRQFTSEETVAGSAALSTGGTIRCQPGDVVRAYLHQETAVTLNIDDTYKEAAFTGCWIGP